MDTALANLPSSVIHRLIIAAIGFFSLYHPMDVTAQSSSPADEVFSREELFFVISDMGHIAVDYALPPKFIFPDSTRSESVFGIDVSNYTHNACRCDLDWSALASQKVGFAYLKATQGIRYVDPTFLINRNALSNLHPRIYFGAYHFITSTDDINDQIAHFQNVIRPLSSDALPPSLDLEWHLGPLNSACPNNAVIRVKTANNSFIERCDYWAFVPADEIIRRVNIAIDTIKLTTGRDALIYTNSVWWHSRIGPGRRMDELHTKLVWIADYSSGGLATERPRVPGDNPWNLWQFSDTAGLVASGRKIAVDASIFNGSMPSMLINLGAKN